MRKKTIAVEPTDTRIVNLFNALKSEESSGASEYTSRAIDADTREFRNRLNDWHQTLGANPSLKEDVGSFDPEDVIAEKIPRLIVGRILSWEYVLNSKSLREEVSGEDRELLAVEMESGACYYAVRRARETLQEDRNTQFVAVRGISDLCNHKADDVFRELAADHAAAVTIGFLYSKFSLRQLV